jgi:exosortase K
MKHVLLANWSYYLLTLLLAFGLKYHYSRASSEDLDWILRPTAGVVEWLSGVEFQEEIGTGYINHECYTIIAPSCAGVNFLIAALCMSICSFLHHLNRCREKWSWIASCLATNYLLTLFINAIRILLAIHFYQTGLSFGWLTPERLHRLEGIIVYLLALYLLFLALQRLSRSAAHKRTLYFLPFGWYGLIVLGVPLVNTAYRGNLPLFLEHCSFVIVGGALMISLVMVIQVVWNLRRSTK